MPNFLNIQAKSASCRYLRRFADRAFGIYVEPTHPSLEEALCFIYKKIEPQPHLYNAVDYEGPAYPNYMNESLDLELRKRYKAAFRALSSVKMIKTEDKNILKLGKFQIPLTWGALFKVLVLAAGICIVLLLAYALFLFVTGRMHPSFFERIPEILTSILSR